MVHGSWFWNIQNMDISRCCFVTLNNGKRNEQRIITQAFTAIVLVDAAVKSLFH